MILIIKETKSLMEIHQYDSMLLLLKHSKKIPTQKKVILIALKKSNPKVFIKSIDTSKPVPEDMEPFNMPIIKTKTLNFIQIIKSIFLFILVKPKSGLVKE